MQIGLLTYKIRLFFLHNHQHWTFNYVIKRLYRITYNIFVPGLPWLPLTAIKYLKCKIKKNYKGIEFGSGNSTFFFSKLCKELVSYENNYLFYKEILKSKKKNIKIIYSKKYPSLIKNQKNNYYDFCLVDGLSRDLCIYNVLPKLKKKSFLIIDNINWYIPFISKSPYTAKNYLPNSKWEIIFKKLRKCRKYVFDDDTSCTMVILINKKNKKYF